MRRYCRRSWGWWFTIIDAKRFKVKLLKFNDRCTCSLQHHYLRNELWLFLYGKGSFELNGMRKEIGRGEWIQVGIRDNHRFYSLGCTWVLEVQYGEKCEEQDIVRI